MLPQILRDAGRGHRGLVALAVACLPCAVVVLVLGFLDPRTIGGAPAWNKPLKFFLSAGTYAVTFAWYLAQWPASSGAEARLRRALGSIVAVMLAIELVLIAAQAGRGVGSHFNVATALDATIFSAMGVAILTLSIAHAVLWVLLLRADWADRPLRSACRWGAGVSLAGLMVGALMVAPTADQRAAMRDGMRTAGSGAHSVGRPDGGPGLPFLGWRTDAGDRRVPHFVGLHAMQILPLALLLAPSSRPRTRQRVVTMAGVACAVVTLLVFAQAESARPLLPGALGRPEGRPPRPSAGHGGSSPQVTSPPYRAEESRHVGVDLQDSPTCAYGERRARIDACHPGSG